jgi:hypothetical protein
MIVSTFLNALAQYMDDIRTGVIARGRRLTTSSTTTTEIGVLRIDDIPITGGRGYKISTSCISMQTTVANDIVIANVRYTTDGSTPTTASTALGGVGVVVTNPAFGMAHPFIGYYYPTADETLSVLLTVTRASGTGNVSLGASATQPIDLFVEDAGVDSGDVGVDI